MKCSIARCPNDAIMRVTFRTSPNEPTPYCGFHGRDRNRDLRWPDSQVADVERLR